LNKIVKSLSTTPPEKIEAVSDQLSARKDDENAVMSAEPKDIRLTADR
jgi:hypothetical protein